MKVADPGVARGGGWILDLKEWRSKNGIETFSSRISPQPQPATGLAALSISLAMSRSRRGARRKVVPRPKGMETEKRD